MTIMFKNTTIALSKQLHKLILSARYRKFHLPAQKLPGKTACYQSNIIKVSVSNKVSEHSKKVANLCRIDIGLVNVRMDKMREAKKSIK